MKTLSRSSKSDRPPERKLSSLIKTKSPRTSSSRPPLARGRSPDVKRSSIHLKKGPHSSRSHVPNRRSTSPYPLRGLPPPPPPLPMDSSKYTKKRKPYSNSPPPGRPTGSPRKHLTPSPHNRMPRNGNRPSPGYDVSRKKIRREPPRVALVQRPSEKPMHSHPDNRMPHRVIESPRDYVHERPREYSPRPTTVRPTYSSAGPSREGFSISERSHPRRMIDAPYEKRDDYVSIREKHHGPTLNDRFRDFNDDDVRSHDHRISYSRADLQNITIDVRGVRDSSPTIRKILNPADVKIVRHAAEGRRPIFDREEIKQSSRDMREDPYNERKLAGGTHFGLNYGELENFEITRHKFDTTSYQGLLMRDESILLSDRWRRVDDRRTNSPVERDERSRAYVHRSRSPEPYPEKTYAHRPHSTDRDFRGERYPSSNNHHMRPLEFPESRRPLPNDPLDLRHSLAVKKKDISVQRQRVLERRPDHSTSRDDYRHNYAPPPRRVPMDSGPEKMREKRSLSPRRMDYPKPRREPSISYNRERSLDQGRPRHSKPPEYSRRSIEPPPKMPSYYEHDKREFPNSYRGNRGGGVSSRSGFRGRGLRGRPVRGLIRGASRGRGSFRGMGSFRGKSSYPPRRGRRSSPYQWEHDMYDKVKQD